MRDIISIVKVAFLAFVTGSVAQPAVVPKSVIARVGTYARFNCTTDHDQPVYWSTTPYGSLITHDIYIGEKFLLNGYAERISVEVSISQRRYDLVIKGIRQTDAGVYTCTDERGLGKMDHAELVVWDSLTCQVNQQKDSYMGENVFALDQDVIDITCRMNYSGNIRPQFEWTIGERKFNGTQGTEFGIVSSSLILVAKSVFDGANVTCEASIRGKSNDNVRTEVLWRSDAIQVNYAVLTKEVVKECPDVENTLKCSPPCSYTLETVIGIQRCAVSYSAGDDVKWFHFYQDSAHNYETGNSVRNTNMAAADIVVFSLLSGNIVIVLLLLVLCICRVRSCRKNWKLQTERKGITMKEIGKQSTTEQDAEKTLQTEETNSLTQ